MSQRQGREIEQGIPRARIYIEIGELSSKQRGAVLGLLKDMGFTPAEISEVVVRLPEEVREDRPPARRGKRE